MKKSDLERRIKELELELQNIKSNSVSSINQIASVSTESGDILQDNIKILNDVTQNMFDMVAFFSNEGKILYVSPSFKRVLGYLPQIGKDMMEYVHPDDIEHVVASINKFMGTYLPETHELRLRNSEGNYLWVESISNIYKNKDGEIAGMMTSARDISERKKTEQALRESEEKLRQIGNNIPKGQIYQFVVEQNGNMRFTYVSKKVEELHECSVEQAIANPNLIFKRVLPEDFTGLQAAAEKSVREMCEFDHRFRIKRNSGEIRWHRTISRPQKISNNQILFDGIELDVTAQKEYELQLHNYSQELEKLSKDKDKFMSILAHDLKNPFNILLSFSDLLAKNVRQYDIDIIEQHVKTIDKVANNTYTILENILEWSLIQSNRKTYIPDALKLHTTGEYVFEEAKNLAQQKNIQLINNISPTLIAYADKDALKTVLRNLISNAIKFTHNNGTVTLNSKEGKTKNKIVVSVEDNGVGIKKQVLSEIFNSANIVSNNGTANEKGTGLGLQICKEFVEKMGGELGAKSKVGKGSVFYFTIPLKPMKIQSEQN